FQAVNKIESTEVSWTLGKAVLYAASLIPPNKDNSLPVGFGSNVPGVPKDFQYPGSRPSPSGVPLPNPNGPGVEESDAHWHESLFGGDSPRRIPGIFLFILILMIVIFFLCGRDRRKRFYRKINRTF